MVLGEQFVRVLRPRHKRFFQVIRVISLLLAQIFIYFVLTTPHEWVVWTGAPDERFAAIVKLGGRDLSLVDLINYVISANLIIVAVAMAADLVKTLLIAVTRGPRQAIQI